MRKQQILHLYYLLSSTIMCVVFDYDSEFHKSLSCKITNIIHQKLEILFLPDSKHTFYGSDQSIGMQRQIALFALNFIINI